LAKIAVDLERALARQDAEGTAGLAAPRTLAHGDGWSVADVICTSGPGDRSFEEQHGHYAIAVVVAGTFNYRSSLGVGVMTPGALMLGNPGQCYECGHQHGRGDRCVAFWYAPEYFERLAAGISARGGGLNFRRPRIPALRLFAPLVARAASGVLAPDGVPWEEIGVNLAALAAGASATGSSVDARMPLNAEARVTRAVRLIERHPDARLPLARLARESGLSPYHFLRTFERLIGVTPHQFVLRTRLRQAALRLTDGPGGVLDIALDCGFADVSNFNRAFRAEFGMSPSRYRSPLGRSPIVNHSP
jgi:AraC family transcriptional regulator